MKIQMILLIALSLQLLAVQEEKSVYSAVCGLYFFTCSTVHQWHGERRLWLVLWIVPCLTFALEQPYLRDRPDALI